MEGTDENIYRILLDIKDQIGELKATASSTLAQTLKTNGRVTKLEHDVESMQEVQSNWKGKIAIISSIAALGGSLLVSWVKERML